MRKRVSRLLENKEIKNAGWLITGRVVQMILSFLIGIVTTRFLGPSNFGLINYGSSYVLLFTSLCTLGLNSIIIKELFNYPNKQGEILGSSILLRLLSSLLSIALITIISITIDKGEQQTVVVVFLCSLTLVFQSLDTFNYWFQSRYESNITAVCTLIAYFVTSLFRVILLLINADVYWFAIASAVDTCCLGLLLLYSFKKKSGVTLSFNQSRGKSLLYKSYHFILSGMMVAIYGQTDKLMLKHMMDTEQVGYYSLAVNLNAVWFFVLQAIIDSMYPTILSLYKEDKSKFEKKNIQLYSIVIYLSTFVAICFMVFGKVIISILYGEEYISAAEPLSIVTWYTIFAYLGVARNAWIVSENKQKYLKYIYLCAVVINIGLNGVFIPIMGAAGAAFASLITQVFTSIILPFLIKGMRENVRLITKAILLPVRKVWNHYD